MTLSALFTAWQISVKDCPDGYALAQLLESAQGMFQEEALWTGEAWVAAVPDAVVYEVPFSFPVALVLSVGSSTEEDVAPLDSLDPVLATPTETGAEFTFDAAPLSTGYLYAKVVFTPSTLTQELPFSLVSPEMLALRERLYRDLAFMGGRPWSDAQEAARRDDMYQRKLLVARAGKMKGGIHSRQTHYTHPEELS